MKKNLMHLAILSLMLVACDDFLVKDISDNEVSIIAPSNNVTLNANKATLVWEPVDGAEEYHVVIVSPSFSEVIYHACDSITTDYKIEVSLPIGTYEWSVQATNSAYSSLKTIGKFQISLQ